MKIVGSVRNWLRKSIVIVDMKMRYLVGWILHLFHVKPSVPRNYSVDILVLQNVVKVVMMIYVKL